MRRFIIGCSVAAVLLLGGLASSTAVQATTPPSEAPAESQPVVGAWVLTVEEFPDDPPELVAFHADGTYQSSSADGTTGIGAWEATGPSSFNLTFLELDDEGPSTMIRAAGEVSEDGQSFTAEFTIGFIGEGAPAGEYGPGHVTATRINVEPMGTPAGSLEDLFAQFDDGTAPADTAPAGTATSGHRTVGHGASGHRTGRHRTSRHRAGRHRTSGHHTDRHSGGNHDRLAVGRSFDGTRLAPQCWTRREPPYPACAWGGDSVPGAGG